MDTAVRCNCADYPYGQPPFTRCCLPDGHDGQCSFVAPVSGEVVTFAKSRHLAMTGQMWADAPQEPQDDNG